MVLYNCNMSSFVSLNNGNSKQRHNCPFSLPLKQDFVENNYHILFFEKLMNQLPFFLVLEI